MIQFPRDATSSDVFIILTEIHTLCLGVRETRLSLNFLIKTGGGTVNLGRREGPGLTMPQTTEYEGITRLGEPFISLLQRLSATI